MVEVLKSLSHKALGRSGRTESLAQILADHGAVVGGRVIAFGFRATVARPRIALLQKPKAGRSFSRSSGNLLHCFCNHRTLQEHSQDWYEWQQKQKSLVSLIVGQASLPVVDARSATFTKVHPRAAMPLGGSGTLAFRFQEFPRH